MSRHPRSRRARRAVLALSLAGAVACSPAPAPPPAAADRALAGAGRTGGDTEIVLPGARSAEGITAGEGTTFYAGDLGAGDIFRGDVATGTAERFIDAPDGRSAAGLAYDAASGLLFAAGARTGEAAVYDVERGTEVASYRFGPATGSFVNSVAVTDEGAWFTDSLQPRLYFVPLSAEGAPGESRTLELTGPAATTDAPININGIQAVPDGRLLVAHSGNAALYTVDPATGQSTQVTGLDLPNVDGLVLDGRRLWAVQNFRNQVSRIALADDLASGRVEEVITSERFQVPTTAARFGDRLGVVNAKFDTGMPPTADEYEVVLVDG